jgi:TP901 family phage tail tape measure protein
VSLMLNLGSLTMGVRMDFSQFDADKAKLATATGAARDQILLDMDKAATGSLTKMAQMTSQVGNLFATMGAGILGVLGGAVQAGENFNQTLLKVAANTGMNDAELNQMTATVEDLGTKVGVPLAQLADGYMHISNFGYKAAEATQLLSIASKAAAATGGDAGKTANLLAGTMHEFQLPVGQAAQVMSLLVNSAAKANATLPEFVNASGEVFGMASNMGVSLQEASAAMAALTQHGFTAAEAGTQVKDILAHIVDPAAKVERVLAGVSKRTGVDLVSDFSKAGLRAKDFSGVLADVDLAAQRLGVRASDLAGYLIPSMRGGIGFMSLAGTAAKDFADRLHEANAEMAGDGSKAAEAFARQQKSLAEQVQRAKNSVTELAGKVEQALLPSLTKGVGLLSHAFDWFAKLNPGIRDAAIQFAAAAATGMLFVGMAAKLASGMLAVKAALAAAGLEIPTLIAGIEGMGTAMAAFAAGPMAAVLAGLAIIAGGATLVITEVHRQQDLAHRTYIDKLEEQRNNRNRRGQPSNPEELANLEGYEQRLPTWGPARIQQLQDEIKSLQSDRNNRNRRGETTNTPQIQADQERIGEIQRDLDAYDKAHPMYGPPVPWSQKSIFERFPPPAVFKPGAGDRFLQNLAHPEKKPQTDRDAEREANDAQKAAEERAKAMKETQGKLFDLTHNDRDQKIRDAQDERDDAIKSGASVMLADNVFRRKKKLAEDEYELGLKKAAQKKDLARQSITDDTARLTMNPYDQERLAAQRQYDSGMRDDSGNKVQLAARLAAQLKQIADREDNENRERHNKEIAEDQENLQKQYEDADKAATERKQLADEARQSNLEAAARVFDFNYRMGITTEEEYRRQLEKQLQDYQEYSDRWMEIKERLKEMDKSDDEAIAKAQTKQKGDGDEGFGSGMAQVGDKMQSIFGDDFGKMFDKGNKGFKSLTKNLLKDFTKMLEEMVAQWLAKWATMMAMQGIGSLFGGLFGGGGGASAGALMQMFDDAGNDRKAEGWGQDFLQHFGAGMRRYNQITSNAGRASAMAGMGGGGDTHYHTPVHIHNPVINHPVDIDRLANEISYKAARSLRAVRRGNGS